MFKLFFICQMLLTFCICAIAQDAKKLKQTSFYVGPQVSMAAADLADTHTWGIGVNSHVVHRIASRTSLVGRLNYTYLFGKKYDHGFYEPGGNYGGERRKYKGMSDINLTGGIRYDLNSDWFAGVDAGLCLGISDGETGGSYLGMLELGYAFGGEISPLEQALAIFLGLCGDPEIQIGLRYSIKL